MKLISMTAFVLNQHNNLGIGGNTYQCFTKKCSNYANFLNQPLTLGMFVPCDDEGNILDELTEPKRIDYWSDNDTVYSGELFAFNLKQWKLFKQAKERVLFEGFVIENEKFFDLSFYDVVRNKDTYVFVKDKEWEKVNDYNTIEDLVLYKLQLTPNAIKQLGL